MMTLAVAYDTSNDQLRMLTARAATIATVTSDATACKPIRLFAMRVSGMVSVGLNAVALVRLT